MGGKMGKSMICKNDGGGRKEEVATCVYRYI